MAEPHATWGEAVTAALAGVPVLGLIVVYLRGRSELFRQVERVKDHADERIDRIKADLIAHKDDVARTRASVDYVSAVERRVGQRLDRLETAIGGRFDRIESLLIEHLKTKGPET